MVNWSLIYSVFMVYFITLFWSCCFTHTQIIVVREVSLIIISFITNEVSIGHQVDANLLPVMEISLKPTIVCKTTNRDIGEIW